MHDITVLLKAVKDNIKQLIEHQRKMLECLDIANAQMNIIFEELPHYPPDTREYAVLKTCIDSLVKLLEGINRGNIPPED